MVRRWLVDNCYSPPKDGATSIIYAATVPWAQDRAVVDGTPVVPGSDLRCVCLLGCIAQEWPNPWAKPCWEMLPT